MTSCKNMGSVDRGVRALVGIVALVFAFATLGVLSGALLGVVALAFGVIMLGTAAMGTCPAYMPLKIDTREDGAR